MIKLIRTSEKTFAKQWQALLHSTASTPAEIVSQVNAIVQEVRAQGDRALLAYTQRFDGVQLKAKTLRVTASELKAAWDSVPAQTRQLLKRAAQRVRRFHERQKSKSWELRQAGVAMGLRWTPLERVGLYVPGGQAAYPSTVLMNAIPAQVAGVDRLVMVTPSPRGQLSALTLAAAYSAGIDEIYRIGGAQAIAALAYGTETIPAVDKIVGPGNIYVATAKQQVFGRVAIDMIAGPTEVLVLADKSARPELIAAELLSQAEHDQNARPFVIGTDIKILQETCAALTHQLAEAPRAAIARPALQAHGVAILAESKEEALRLCNELAPEHLVIMTQQPRQWMKGVRHAGAIFLGAHTPVAAGDYLVGPNHVLPTARTARYASPLGVYDFLKASSYLELSAAGLQKLGPDLIALAELEGLAAHGASVRLRLKGRR